MSANAWNLGFKLSCLCLALVPLAFAGPAEAKPVLTLLPVNTNAIAINDSGVVVGTEIGREIGSVAFVRTPDGTMTTFAIKGANGITPTGINSSGVVTGTYLDAYST